MPNGPEYHFSWRLDDRLTSGLGVARFNLFSKHPPPQLGPGSEAEDSTLIDVTEFAIAQLGQPPFELILDLHESAVDVVALERSTNLPGWEHSARGRRVTSWRVRAPGEFKSILNAAGQIADGTLFFRVVVEDSMRDNNVSSAAFARCSVPPRSEEGYAAFLPLYFAVGLIECQSRFVSVLSRSSMLIGLARASQSELNAKLEVA